MLLPRVEMRSMSDGLAAVCFLRPAGSLCPQALRCPQLAAFGCPLWALPTRIKA